jgi:hypothetical protein
MAGSRALRLGSLAGFVLFPMMIVGFGLDMSIIVTSGGPPLLAAENISSDLLRAQGVAFWPVELWLYTLMIIPGSVLAISAYRALRSDHDDGYAAAGLLSITLFWIFHTIHNVLMLAIFQAVVPRYASGSPDAATMEIVTVTVLKIALAMFNFGTSVGALCLAGSLAAFGLATLKSAGFPRWTGYVSLASSLAVLGSYLQFLANAFFFLGLVGWILFIVWVIGATFALRRSSRQAQAAAS